MRWREDMQQSVLIKQCSSDLAPGKVPVFAKSPTFALFFRLRYRYSVIAGAQPNSHVRDVRSSASHTFFAPNFNISDSYSKKVRARCEHLFRSDNGAVRRLKHPASCPVPRHGVRYEAILRRTGERLYRNLWRLIFLSFAAKTPLFTRSA